ncbi:serine hydrolase domain-containing protein [Robertkochia aurantiaca]|uniref:serine hydrolase domain-containing protein n=1 Tax=Robertkochia aurantiaca TaxID=2873700 RepID=UPI001CCD6B4B|nr:serine hydrolase [Robertkochia sp. 3YJGBD-33]
MKRVLKYLLLLFVFFGLVVAGLVIIKYPQLDILTGYASKNACSCLFLADRDPALIDIQDNGFMPVKLAEETVNPSEGSTQSSVIGVKSRKAVYHEGLGCTLLPPGFKQYDPQAVPERSQTDSLADFPFNLDSLPGSELSQEHLNDIRSIADQAFEHNDEKQTRALLVWHKDRLIYERYAKGIDENTRLLGWSMTKSVLATLYGILISRGELDMDEKPDIPEWQNDKRKLISYRNLLQMSSGLAWDENYNALSDVTRMLFKAPDMAAVQKGKPLEHVPGDFWLYSSGTTNLLSGLLAERFDNRQEYLNFPYKELIDRIGMNSMVMETDPSLNYVGSSYGWARARDWLKFGLLYLKEGDWYGTRIFDPEWAEFVQTPAIDSKGTYGGHFWLNSSGVMPDVPLDAYYANGYQGQRVMIVPSKELVIVRLGLGDESVFDFNYFFGEICKSLP